MNKKVLLIASGVGALVAGVLIYRYCSRRDSQYDQLHRTLAKLGRVQFESFGLIQLDYLVELYGAVLHYAKQEAENAKLRYYQERKRAR